MGTFSDNKVIKVNHKDGDIATDHIQTSPSRELPYRVYISQWSVKKISIEPEGIEHRIPCNIELRNINCDLLTIYPKTHDINVTIAKCNIKKIVVYNIGVVHNNNFNIYISNCKIESLSFHEIALQGFHIKTTEITNTLEFKKFSAYSESEIIDTTAALFDYSNCDFRNCVFTFFKIKSDILLSSSTSVLSYPLCFLLSLRKFRFLKENDTSFYARVLLAYNETVANVLHDISIQDHIETLSRFDIEIDKHFPHYKLQFDLEKKYCELQNAIARRDRVKGILLFLHLVISNFSFSPLRTFLWIMVLLVSFTYIHLMQGFYIYDEKLRYIQYSFDLNNGLLYTPDFLSALRLTLHSIAMKSSNIYPRDTILNTLVLVFSVTIFPTLLAMLILAIKRVTKSHS